MRRSIVFSIISMSGGSSAWCPAPFLYIRSTSGVSMACSSSSERDAFTSWSRTPWSILTGQSNRIVFSAKSNLKFEVFSQHHMLHKLKLQSYHHFHDTGILLTLTLVSTSTKLCILDLTGLIRVITILHLLYQFQATLSPEPRPELNDPIRAEPPWSSSFVVE